MAKPKRRFHLLHDKYPCCNKKMGISVFVPNEPHERKCPRCDTRYMVTIRKAARWTDEQPVYAVDCEPLVRRQR